MAIRDILVHAQTGRQPETLRRHALTAAAALAVAHDARLIGLGLVPTIPSSFYSAGWVPAAFIEQLVAEGKAAVEAARLHFEETLRRFGLTARGEWREAEGDPVAALALHGRYADLVVVDQSDPDREAPSFGIASDLALFGGRPVLIAPRAAPTETIGTRPLIAWNASRESARAVADAMPILAHAGRADVLVVSPRGIGDLPGSPIARHLAAHGIEAEIFVRDSEIEAGIEILNFAAERGSDLIVMGCYGHQRMRQAVFGGATRTILSDSPIPALLSH